MELTDKSKSVGSLPATIMLEKLLQTNNIVNIADTGKPQQRGLCRGVQQ